MPSDSALKGRVLRIVGASAVVLAGLLVAAGPAAAQQAAPGLPAGATPQARYEHQIAVCNSGQLPAPQRDACVRDAGRLLDNRLGGPPEPVPQTSPDGQSTVISPPNQPVPSGDPTFVTSPDGRAVIGVPAGAPRP